MYLQPLTLGEIARAAGGVLLNGGENECIDYITTDSRQAKKGLFVPLIGEKNDGHDFIDSAFLTGASAVLTQRKTDIDKKAVLVADTCLAVGDIAKYYKEKYPVKTVAVVGSVGKTTTKDMVAGVLSSKLKTQKTQGNFNNHLGLPLTIFTIEKEHEAAVLEMGMSGFGEIERLANIGKPDIAVMTNIGTSHIEKLGSRENIFKAKMEVVGGFTEKNLLIANGDDEFLKRAGEFGSYRTVYYGINNPQNDVYARDIKKIGIEAIEFTICDGQGEYHARVNAAGIHNVYNALAAFCAGKAFGLAAEDILWGLENFEQTQMRMEIHDKNGMKIINDCYNAAPDSVRASLAVLAESGGKRKVAVLGDILEMGEYAREAHISLGNAVADSGIDMLITAGENAELIARQAKKCGMKEVYSFKDTESAALFAEKKVKSGDSILIKASRGMKFEIIFDKICGSAE